MFRAAAVIVATLAGLLAAETAFAGTADPVGVWRFPKAELDRSLDRLQDRLKAEYLPDFYQKQGLNKRQANYLDRRVESSQASVVKRSFTGTLEFKRNGQVIGRDGKGKVRSTGQWRVKDGHVLLTGLRLRSEDPFFHPGQFFDPPGRHRQVGNLVGTNRIELQPPLAEMPPVLRRAFRGFELPLVRVTPVEAAAQASEPHAG